MEIDDRSVTLIIPLFNEEEMLPILVGELEQFKAERPEVQNVIFINDGSTDRTLPLAKQLTQDKTNYTILSFSRNFGHQLAVTAGMEHVESDAAIIMDADLQDPLEAAASMIDKWKEGYDVVYGVRESREGESFLKKKTATLFYKFFRWFTDLEVPLEAGDFRLISKEVIDAYNRLPEQKPFVRGLIPWLGYKQCGIRYQRKSRVAGETKYPLSKMLSLAFHAITSFTDKPLRIATLMGIALSVLSYIGIVWVFYVRFFLDGVISGWASTLVIMLFFGGMQLFFLGIIGTYISRIFSEVRGRPRYIIESEWSSNTPNS